MVGVVLGDINSTDLPKIELPTLAEEQANEPLSVTIRPDAGKQQREQELQTALDQEAPVAVAEQPVNRFQAEVQKALHNGYSALEVKAYLEQQGMSEDDADSTVVDSLKAKVKDAMANGYNQEEVTKYLLDSGYDQDAVTRSVKAAGLNERYKRLDYQPEQADPDKTDMEKATDLSELYNNVYQKYSTLGKLAGGIFNDDLAIEARQEINQLNKTIATKLKEQGLDTLLDPDNGEVMLRTENGAVEQVDSSFLSRLWNSKSELGGALAGGAQGAVLGSIAGPVGTVVGAIGGSMLGSSLGRGLDLFINSKKLSEDLSANLYMTQMAEAGAFDGIAGVVGGTAIKAGSMAWKGVVNGYKYFSNGNVNGAYRALKDALKLSDGQIKEIVDNWESLNTTKSALSEKEKGLLAVTTTEPLAEGIAKAAAAKDFSILTNLKRVVDERAKGIQSIVIDNADINVGKAVRDNLTSYVNDVKAFFGEVKKQGAEAVDGTDFRFDLDKLAIAPIMKTIEKKLSNPLAKERFVAYASRIEAASLDRSFSGLLELRTAVNDFKYSKTLNTPDLEALNGVLNRIDNIVGKAAKEYIPNGKQWLENFSSAKKEYAKMKVLQENTLYRLITRSGITEDGIQKAIAKYSSNKDVDAEVFNAVVSKLQPSVRTKVESAAMQNLVNKNTFGDATSYQAIDFVQLANDLNTLNIQSPKVKNLQRVVEEFAKVYKNDPALAGYSMALNTKQMTSALGSNPLQILQYSAARSVWNAIYKYLPTQEARNIALVHKLSDLLSNPLHVKTANSLLKSLPEQVQPEMTTLIQELQKQTAKAGIKAPAASYMYKQSKTGTLAVTDGALGKGIYVVDKVAKPSAELQVAKVKIDQSKLATLEDISKLVGQTVSLKEVKKIPDLQQLLVERGFKGIKEGERAMLFPETTLGAKSSKSMAKEITPVIPDEVKAKILNSADPMYVEDFAYDIKNVVPQIDRAKYMELRKQVTKGPKEEVEKTLPINKLISDQPEVNSPGVKQYLTDTHTIEPIDVLEIDGKYYVEDGNHRVMAAIQRGDKTIKAKVTRKKP